MESTDLFGKTFSCACGKTHQIEPEEVVYSQDATNRLPAFCEKLRLGQRVAAIMDVRTREAAGRQVAGVLLEAGRSVHEVIVKDGEGGRRPVCDGGTMRLVKDQTAEVDWIITVGSGVITDLGKWLAAEIKVPFIALATAASMNGFASANVAPTIAGLKTLIGARPPKAVISSPELLSKAPYELTSAGLGDVLSKTISTPDWYMNHVLFCDYYCQKSAELIKDIEPLYKNHPEEIQRRKPEAMEALFQALILTGVSMTMAGTSSPASGGEHLISHALDMMSSRDGQENDLHGRQVGVATVLAAELYKRVLSVESPVFNEPLDMGDPGFWGPYGKVVQEQYVQKIPKMEMAKEKLRRGSGWDEFREKLSPMLSTPEAIRHCLIGASAATRAEDIRSSPSRLSQAFRHANEIRSRFTILDLAYLIGIMPESADEIVEEWA